MRDLLPEEARSRRALARAVLDRLALHGYPVVTPPVFEFAGVLERGLGTLDPTDMLRFVEPESGEVAALRPDMTPQIARMIATRLRDRPPPHRLAYEGSVLRRRTGRARKHRQIPQVGVELAGLAGADGDLEILDTAAAALGAAGVEAFTIDVADAGVVQGLLARIEPSRAAHLRAALARKDEAAVAEIASGLPERDGLAALARLHGGAEVLAEASALLAGSAAEGACARLCALFRACEARGLAVTVDFGEVRGFEYYTGMMFRAYAPGPGEAIGGGGRYDELLARFGAPMPAVGMGIDLDNVVWALREARRAPGEPPRALVVGDRDAVDALRAGGIPAALHAGDAAPLDYARAWGFAYVVAERVTHVSSATTFDKGDDAARSIRQHSSRGA
jgi:ATP phosphoribosyltransferase regulatory subunit